MIGLGDGRSLTGVCGHDVRFCTCGQSPEQKAKRDAELYGQGFILRQRGKTDVYLPYAEVVVFFPPRVVGGT